MISIQIRKFLTLRIIIAVFLFIYCKVGKSQDLHFPINFIIVDPDINTKVEESIFQNLSELNNAFRDADISFSCNQVYRLSSTPNTPPNRFYSQEACVSIYNKFKNGHISENYGGNDKIDKNINVFITPKNIDKLNIDGYSDYPLSWSELYNVNQNVNDLIATDDNNSIFISSDAFITATLIHEMGHFFGLLHVFQGLGHIRSTNWRCNELLNGVNNYTGPGDYIDDTPKSYSISSWNSNIYKIVLELNCPKLVEIIYDSKNYNNYMQYDNPRFLFTEDQINRVKEAKLLPERIILSSCTISEKVILVSQTTGAAFVDFLGKLEIENCPVSSLIKQDNRSRLKSNTEFYGLQITKDLDRYFTLNSGYKDDWNDNVDQHVVVDVQGLIGADGKINFTWDQNTSSTTVFEQPIPGVKYKVTIAKLDIADGGYSSFSNEFEFTVGDYECNGASNFSASNVNIDGADLSWVPGSSATQYIVHWGTNGNYNESASTTGNSYSLQDKLTPNQEYCCYVESICSGGFKTTSPEQCFLTNETTVATNTNFDLKISVNNVESNVAVNSSVSFTLRATHTYTNPSLNYSDVYPNVNLYLSTTNNLSGVVENFGVVPFQLARTSSVNPGTFNFHYSMNMERFVNQTSLGTYYIVAEIDPLDDYDETNESNNISTRSFNLVAEVPGCTDETAHNYNPNASVSDGSCLTCFDNIRNGNELGRDCGGSCRPCVDCPPVNNISVTHTNTSANISWSDTENRNNYSISYRLSSGSDYETIYSDSHSAEVINLVPETQYCYKVKVHCFDIDVESPEYCFTTGSHVDGCIYPFSHNYNENATRDDNSCTTCNDGLLNGSETGIDCGGILCSPCYCQNDIESVDFNIYSNKLIHAKQDVLANHSVLYNFTKFKANNSITLNPGFEVDYSTFEAIIEECEATPSFSTSSTIYKPGEAIDIFYANADGCKLTHDATGYLIAAVNGFGKETISFPSPGTYTVNLRVNSNIGSTLYDEITFIIQSCDGQYEWGGACDDGDPLTINDIIQNNCTCKGTTDYVTDIEGNKYAFNEYGTQTWLIDNLVTTKFNDGTPVSYTTNGNDWESNGNALTPTYCYLQDNPSYKDTYGALYNAAVVLNVPSGYKNICPMGWHVPTKIEWETLLGYLEDEGFGYGGSGDDIGKSMSSKFYWKTASGGNDRIGNDLFTNNSSGFNAIPSGWRWPDGRSKNFKEHANFWAERTTGNNMYYIELNYLSSTPQIKYDIYGSGMCVRCIKD